MSVTPWERMIIPKLKKQTMETVLSRNLRLDGRRLNEYRRIEIIPGYIEKAEGSALVKLGETTVLAGIKTDLVQPFPDTPNEGVLIVNAEFVPLASPVFEPGPPDENAIELARVVDRSLREIKAVALDKLVVIPGQLVWRIYVDIYVLNHDGNLIDASMLASMAALMTTRLPRLTKKNENEYEINRSEFDAILPINHKVVTVSIAKLSNKLLVDPTYEEELSMDLKLTIAVADNGLLAGMQKIGMGYLTEDELEKAINMALSASKTLLSSLEEKVAPYREKLEKELQEATGRAEGEGQAT
ncbi:MAG: exosome complex protein Rrp42 [Pyrodictiaceae archaeon]